VGKQLRVATMAFQFKPKITEDHDRNNRALEAQEIGPSTPRKDPQLRVYRGASRGGEHPQRRLSRPIAIPRRASKGSTEDFTDYSDDEAPNQSQQRPEGVAISLPATFLRAPHLGSSLPAQHRERPPPLQLSVAVVETPVPYGSLRDHRHHQQHHCFATSVPHIPTHNNITSNTATTSTTTPAGIAIAERIRLSRNANTASSCTSSSAAAAQQISSLSRMMKEAVKISSPESPRLVMPDVFRDDDDEVNDQPGPEQVVSRSLTGLQLLQGRGWSSSMDERTTLATTTEPTRKISETEEGAFALDME
jgi:hypothetical protein